MSFAQKYKNEKTVVTQSNVVFLNNQLGDIMALPLLAVGVVGIYVYKKFRDKEYYDLKNKKEDLEKEKSNYETTRFHIKSVPFIIASLYAIANIDGRIDEDEEAFIKYKINEKLEEIEDKQLKESILKSLQEIEQNKLSIKLSDAIDYITFENEDFVKRNLREYKKLASDLSIVDNKQDDREIELLERFDIICNKGREAKKEIIELENQDLLPNFYYASSNRYKKITPSTQIITQDNTEFININELQLDKYYVKHPMNPQKLFDLQQLDKIDEIQIAELDDLANKLGAKKFLCSVITEEKETNGRSQDFGSSFENNAASVGGKVQNTSSLEEYQNRFKQHNWTAEGKHSGENKETILAELLWLKNNAQARGMIEAMDRNKLKTYDIEVSLKKFKNENSSFNLSAHLSLLEKIDTELKRKIENNIQKSLNHTLKISIEF